MQFKVDSKQLVETLSAISGALSTKDLEPAYLRVRCILNSEKETLTLMTSNGEIVEYGTIEAKEVTGFDTSKYEFLLLAEKFIKLVRTFKAKDAVFEIEDEDVKIRAARAHIKLTRSTDESRMIDAFEVETEDIEKINWNWVELDWTKFLRKITFAQNDTTEETAAVSLAGVQLTLTPDDKKIAIQARATNRTRIAHFSGKTSLNGSLKDPLDFHLKKEVASEMIARSSSRFGISDDGKMILVEGKNNTKLYWDVADSTFPNLDEAINSAQKDKGVTLTFNRATIANTLERAVLSVDPISDLRQVTMKINKTSIEDKLLSMEGDSFESSFNDIVEVASIDGLKTDIEIIFDPVDVNDYIKVATRDEIEMKVVENLMIIVTQEETILEDQTYIYMVSLMA